MTTALITGASAGLGEAYTTIGLVRNQPLIGQLMSLGYRFAEVPKCLWSMRLNRIDPANTTGRLANDILAVREGPVGDAILVRVNAL